MYNLDELTSEDLVHMNRYMGEMVFFHKTDCDNEPNIFLKSLNNGEIALYSINLHEIREIFSKDLFELAQRNTLILDFYADINPSGELYNIKELAVYERYFPWHD